MIDNENLAWPEIEKHYHKEWVLLEDFDWPVGQPYPSSGKVICHSPDKKQFDAEAKKNDAPKTAWLFVGKPDLPYVDRDAAATPGYGNDYHPAPGSVLLKRAPQIVPADALGNPRDKCTALGAFAGLEEGGAEIDVPCE